MTGSNGEARFFIRVVSTMSQALVQMTAPQAAAPLQFLVNVTRIRCRPSAECGGGGDFNHDGLPDLVTANFSSNDATVLLGRGDGTFPPSSASPWRVSPLLRGGGGSRPRRPARPGTVNFNSNDISVLLGRGDGTFTTSNVSLWALAPCPWRWRISTTTASLTW